jgi:hypothetical protein
MTIPQSINEEAISTCVKAAIEKLDKVDADAEKEKTQIVKDLAKDLEGKIPTESICNEIVHQLHGKVSPRLIRVSLDEKYKEKYRVDNARKQKKKHESTEDSAAQVPLNNGDIDSQKKKIIIDTSGNEISGPQPSVIEATDYDDSGKDPEDKQNRTMQLLTQAENGFSDNNLETKEELTIKPSFNDEIIYPIKQTENLTDTKKEVLVSHISMSFEDLRKDMATVFQTTKGIGKIFFKVSVDIGTSLVELQFCGITQDNTMTSTGKGKLKEAGTNFLLGS